MKKVFLRLILPLLLPGLWYQCANIQTPTGGPKDKRPPKITASTPQPNQVNFKGRTVLLTFDERIKLNSPRDEIIISPSLGREVEFTTKGNNVFITPKDPWKDSTTYSILFREGIQDITESNAPPNLKLAFSTGPEIDSLVIAGNVTTLLEGLPVDKATVAIYASDTFDIFEHTPSYFTKTDKRGNFKLENIRAGKYRIYAFNDVNKNLKVESQAEMYGFLQRYIALQTSIDTLSIGLVRLDSRPLKLSSIRNAGTVTRLRFSKALIHYQVSADKEVPNSFGDNQSEITFWNPEGSDSVRIIFSGTDSLENKVDTTFYIKKTNIIPSPGKFTWSIAAPNINPDNARLESTLKFSKPLKEIHLDSLFIQVDTTSRILIAKEDIQYNQQKKEIVISKSLNKKMFGPDQDPQLRIMARPAFAISYDGDTTKSVTNPIVIFWPEENGTLSLQATTAEKAYLIQLIDKSSGKIVVQANSAPKFTAKNIPPAEYQIRIIVDANQNGRWDPGNILRDIEPEKVIYYKTSDGTSVFPIRANWEVGPLQLRF